jgi:signal transduction histidine kinase
MRIASTPRKPRDMSAILRKAPAEKPIQIISELFLQQPRTFMPIRRTVDQNIDGSVVTQPDLLQARRWKAMLAMNQDTIEAVLLDNERLSAELIVERRERKKAEKALRDNETSLGEMQRISRSGTWRWNVRTGAVQWSVEHFRIFGFDPAFDKPSHSKYMQRIHPEDHFSVERTLAEASFRKSMFSHEYRIVLPDGSIKHVQSSGHPDKKTSSDLEFVGTVLDISERRHAEEAASRAKAELARLTRLSTMGELAGSIIHEVVQPLTAIVMNAEACLRWLDRDQPDLGKARSTISDVVRDGQRANDVVKGLRALARRSGSEMTKVDINDAIREVMTLLRSELQRGGVTLQIDLVSDEMPILGDRVQLQQVLLNLVRNGIEAMCTISDRPRILRIRSELTENGEGLFAIEDTGVGLNPASADRIFDPLFTTKLDGMGMGLSICRSIVEAHRGRLWASPTLAHGTVMRFTLPFAEPTTGRRGPSR